LKKPPSGGFFVRADYELGFIVWWLLRFWMVCVTDLLVFVLRRQELCFLTLKWWGSIERLGCEVGEYLVCFADCWVLWNE